MTTIRPTTMKEGVFPAFCGRIPPLLLAAMFAYSPEKKTSPLIFCQTKITNSSTFTAKGHIKSPLRDVLCG